MHPTSKARRTPYDDSCLDSPWALPCMFRARKKWSVLDRRYATTPVLAASFTDCVSNTYDSDMQKGHRQGSKSNGYFILDEVYKFCVCCRQWPQVIRNNACYPPIIMMTSYRFYWHGAQQSLLRTSVSTRSLFGPDCFEHDN